MIQFGRKVSQKVFDSNWLSTLNYAPFKMDCACNLVNKNIYFLKTITEQHCFCDPSSFSVCSFPIKILYCELFKTNKSSKTGDTGTPTCQHKKAFSLLGDSCRHSSEEGGLAILKPLCQRLLVEYGYLGPATCCFSYCPPKGKSTSPARVCSDAVPGSRLRKWLLAILL